MKEVMCPRSVQDIQKAACEDRYGNIHKYKTNVICNNVGPPMDNRHIVECVLAGEIGLPKFTNVIFLLHCSG